jgi:hypothetical protein
MLLSKESHANAATTAAGTKVAAVSNAHSNKSGAAEPRQAIGKKQQSTFAGGEKPKLESDPGKESILSAHTA